MDKFKVGDVVKIKKKKLHKYESLLKAHGAGNDFEVICIREYIFTNRNTLELRAIGTTFFIHVAQGHVKKTGVISPLHAATVDKATEQINREYFEEANSDKNKYEIEKDSVLGQWLTNVIGNK